MAVLIHVDGADHEFDPGLISGARLYELSGGLLQLQMDGWNIPVLSEDYLLIRGGEKFISEGREGEENPVLPDGLKPSFSGDREVMLLHPKITVQDLKAHDTQFPDGRLFAETLGEMDVEIRDDARLIIQNEDSYFVIPPGDFGSVIDIEECGKHNCRVPRGGVYRYRLDHETYVSETAKTDGTQILARADKNLDEWSLNQKVHGGRRIKIDGGHVDLTNTGIERFESIRRHAQQG